MKSLIVRDEISFKESSDFWWFMHTPAEVTVEGNTAYLKNGMTMKVEVISNQPLEFGVMDAVPLETSPIVKGAIKNNPNKGIKKLYLHLDGWGDTGYDNCNPDYLPACIEAGGWEGLKHLSNTLLTFILTSAVTPSL